MVKIIKITDLVEQTSLAEVGLLLDKAYQQVQRYAAADAIIIEGQLYKPSGVYVIEERRAEFCTAQDTDK